MTASTLLTRKIAIVGTGNVGTALKAGLSRASCDIRIAKKGQIAEIASWADVIIAFRGSEPTGRTSPSHRVGILWPA